MVTSESSASDTQSQGTDHVGDIIGPGMVRPNNSGGSNNSLSIGKESRPASNRFVLYLLIMIF